MGGVPRRREEAQGRGITPFGMGNKDGYGGAWFFSRSRRTN
jgi:hypothetical protein